MLWLQSPSVLVTEFRTLADLWPLAPSASRVNAFARACMLVGAVQAFRRRSATPLAVSFAVAALGSEVVRERKRAVSDATDEELLRKMAERALEGGQPSSLETHPLAGANPNPLDYGKEWCSERAPIADVEKPEDGETDLGMFVYRVPDVGGCARPPTFDDLFEPTEISPERTCAYRRCR